MTDKAGGESAEQIRVTELRELAPKRFLAGFSDGAELRLSLDTVAALSLYKGRALSPEAYAGLRSAAALSACKERALRLIGARPLSKKELFNKLTEKGETPENAEECVGWLERLHYLDDAQYAGMIVRHYAGKCFGARRIKGELYRRGVPRALWDEALAALDGTEERVYELLRRRLGGEMPDRAGLKKAADALSRRGFSWDEINAAVRRYREEN
ncbi:MAG: recombination regulator RecX [Oscillospiraceae bacterium]|jgi:regulatory protein|nr:recombination regulator RecX [Oscillospiraceae bacterium]